MSRMNVSGYVYGHVTIFSLNCVLFSRPSKDRVRIGVRIRFSVWLVSCYAQVFVRL